MRPLPNLMHAHDSSPPTLLPSQSALDRLSISDQIRIYLTMRARHLPAALAHEIQNQIAAVAVRSHRHFSLLGFFSTIIIGWLLLPFDHDLARMWASAQAVLFATLFVLDRRLQRLKSEGRLTAVAVNTLLFLPTLAYGLLWGSLLYIVGMSDVGHHYLTLTVLVTICSLGFFWPAGHWPLSIGFATTLLLTVNISNMVLRAPDTTTIAVLSPILVAALIGISIVVAADLVESRGRSAIARERQHMIDLLLRDYERGGHDFLWETDGALRFTHVPPRMALAGHGDERVTQGEGLVHLLKDDPDAIHSVQSGEPFQTVVTTHGPDGTGELRLWGRPKLNGGVCLGYSGVGSDEGSARRAANAETTSERLDAIVTVTSGLAHDFNNHLATVLGAVELISLEPTLSESGRAYAQRAVEAILRSRRLTADLVIASGHDATYQPAGIDVGPAIQRVARDVDELFPQVEVLTQCPMPVRAFADQSHLERALRNLVQNACQSFVGFDPTDRDGCYETPRVVMRASTTIDHQRMPVAEISVIDNGPGIPKELCDVVFEPYVSTRMASGGTGLGLAIARGFAIQAGGTLDLVPTSVGTNFRLRVPEPVFMSDADTDPSSHRALGAVPVDSRLDGHFLVVEDDHQVAHNLSETIEAYGGTVEIVHSVDAARRRFAEATDDLTCVICDLVLPDGEGYDVIGDLRQHRPGATAIYVSGFTRTLPSTVSAELRCPFVAKPFSTSELFRSLMSAGVPIEGAASSPRLVDPTAA